MSTKHVVVSLMIISLFFSFFYIYPTILSKPISRFKPNQQSVLQNRTMVDQNPYPVTFAYLISASKGDSSKLKRLLHALYHPANYYLIHMDQEADAEEHMEMAEFVAANQVFGDVGNVFIVGKPNLVTYRGPTMLATTLHGIAILLRIFKWDWFINLSASDYPLVTQDDLIHVFSELPRDVNFIQHTSHLGWKLNKRAKPILIDPGLYSLNKSNVWWVIKQRTLPTAFKLYTGSAWTILSRRFAEYCILSYEDNLPRTLLLYYANFVSSPEGYFQTLICNADGYKNTTINHDLHYITWHTPPRQHPKYLGQKDYKNMILSNRPFARKFKENVRVLDRIDKELLARHDGGFTYGGWCSNSNRKPCLSLRSADYGILRPGSGSTRLKALLETIYFSNNFTRRQCR